MSVPFAFRLSAAPGDPLDAPPPEPALRAMARLRGVLAQLVAQSGHAASLRDFDATVDLLWGSDCAREIAHIGKPEGAPELPDEMEVTAVDPDVAMMSAARAVPPLSPEEVRETVDFALRRAK